MTMIKYRSELPLEQMLVAFCLFLGLVSSSALAQLTRESFFNCRKTDDSPAMLVCNGPKEEACIHNIIIVN